jgi:alpha-glucosidase
VTRYGRADTAFDMADRRIGEPSDLVLGERRARAAALLSLALPGGVYVYQGDELGLEEVEDLPDGVRQDPIFSRSGRTDKGRDGCRVPIPWSGTESPFGFSPATATAPPWLPQPAHWAARTAAALDGDENSMLALYRRALHLRRGEPALLGAEFAWFPAGDGALAFRRGEDFACVINLGPGPLALPGGAEVLLASGALVDGDLPTDTAVWLRMNPSD